MVSKPEVDVTPDDDDEYEVVTSTRQIIRPELRKELVRCPEIKKSNGKKAQFIMFELTGKEVQDLHDADKVYEKGEWTGRWDRSHQKIKLISQAARTDQTGVHRLWATHEDAIAELGEYPIAVIDRLEAAAQRVSAANAEAEEKKSEKTPKSNSGTN